MSAPPMRPRRRRLNPKGSIRDRFDQVLEADSTSLVTLAFDLAALETEASPDAEATMWDCINVIARALLLIEFTDDQSEDAQRRLIVLNAADQAKAILDTITSRFSQS